MHLSKESPEVQVKAKELNYCGFFSDRDSYEEVMDYATNFNGGEKQSAIVTLGIATNFFIRREARIRVKKDAEIKRLNEKLRKLELKFIRS